MVVYFSLPDTANNFSENEDNSISKKALVLVEGTWTDNKKRTWTFDKDKLFRIAANTNSSFSRGNRIPILKDHNRNQASTVGDLESKLEPRIVTKEDVKDERFSHLVGKLGLFADNVKIKAEDTVKQIKQGLADTISPGINMAKEKIEEISLTPLPAIGGLALFNSNSQNTGLTWEDIMSSDEDYEQLKEQYEELSEKFFQLVINIMQSDDSELQASKQEYLDQAFVGYQELLSDLFGIVDEEPEMNAQQLEQMQINPQMGGMNMQQPQYSMYNTALEHGVDLAEFGWLQSATKVGKNTFRKGKLGLMKFYNPKVPAYTDLKSLKTKKRRFSTGRALGTVGVAGAVGGVGYMIGRKKQEPQRRFGYF